MSWNISELGIYARHSGRFKSLKFRLHGLNIVTGKSNRGKSSILEIADYCMLSKHCPIAKGVIRDAVSHVGAVFRRGDDYFVVVRPLPGVGRLTSSDVFIQQGQNLKLPAVPPEMGWNIETAREALSEFTGIEAVPVLRDFNNPDPDSGAPVQIRHCSFYTQQPQDVIANRNALFVGLEENFKRQHASDAAYYFLGILTIERLRKRRLLRELNRELNALERSLREKERLKTSGFEHGLGLLAEAALLGLCEPLKSNLTLRELMEALEKVSKVESSLANVAATHFGMGELQQREAAVSKNLRRKRLDLANIEAFQAASMQNVEISERQQERLKLRDLFPPSSMHSCPLCGNEDLDPSGIESNLEMGTRALAAVRTSPRRLWGRLDREAKGLRAEIEALETEQLGLQSQLQALLEMQGDARRLLDDAAARERLVGRVREYLANSRRLQTPLDTQRHRLNARIRDLEREVGDASIRRLRDDVEKKLGSFIAPLTESLAVEFPYAPVKVDFSSFSLKIKIDGVWVGLDEIGSGANWLGYHVASTIGLHKLFRSLGSPVPAVLMLDQPSQAWFPAEVASIKNITEPAKPSDMEAVRRMYRVLHAAGQSIPNMQIIVADHARLADSWFQTSIVADWHEDDALVPSSWIS